MASNYFHFTLGPVQGFVAQARRTRDFWAGSFLLSWLSGVAMAEIKRQGGDIKFPIPAEDYLDWITGDRHGDNGPRQGGIPNRFKAFSARVPASFDGALVERTVREAWCKLADHVWQHDQMDQVASGLTRAIWDRQHQHFWEVSWALSEDECASALLDQRKNWRSHYVQPEPGVKCMLMDGWQELSGAERPGNLDKQNRPTPLKRFWDAMRGNGCPGMQTDLAPDEYLCALAYVKRRFVRHFSRFRTTLDSGLTVAGWHLDSGMPSVSYMAAVRWLEKLVNVASTAELEDLHSAAVAVNNSHDEWDTHIDCLVKAWSNKGDHSLRRKLLSLDGNLFHAHAQDNAKAYGYDEAAMCEFKRELADFRAGHPGFVEPLSPFYAVLLMDGDSLGSHMSKLDNQLAISTALQAFTDGVACIVESHNGYLIYAGGDDVLALLPLEDAMGCAAAVRAHYLQCFSTSRPFIPTSISAAIEYAHVKMPLGKVLRDVHGLLDDVAKDGCGRDALAVRVWKPGGMALQWAQPWEIALSDGKLVLETLRDTFRQDEADGADVLSSKFFYHIREQFDLLNPGKGQEKVLDEKDARTLLAVDYTHSGSNRHLSVEDAESKIGPLLEQCRPVKRDKDKARSDWTHSTRLEADGALLVRFLAQKGVEQ